MYWSCWLSVNVRWEFACPFTSVNNKLYITVIQRVRTWNNHKHFQYSYFLLLSIALFTVFWKMILSYLFFFPINRVGDLKMEEKWIYNLAVINHMFEKIFESSFFNRLGLYCIIIIITTIISKAATNKVY